jgi:hypothetical protein
MRVVSIAGYLTLTLLLVVIELVARARPGGRIPTLSATLRHPMRLRATRIALLMAWWWIGWHFFVG